MFDYSKLRGKIKEICNTQDIFAEKMEISNTSLSYKLNNIVPFTQEEIYKAITILGISPIEINEYFFTK